MLQTMKPKFWDQGAGPASHRSLFNYRRLWLLVLGLMFGVSFVPLALMSAIDFQISRQAAEQETVLRMSQLVSNTRRTITYFIEERVSALEFIAADNSPEELTDQTRLAALLELLKSSFAGFTDLGVIGASGVQLAYAGPSSWPAGTTPARSGSRPRPSAAATSARSSGAIAACRTWWWPCAATCRAAASWPCGPRSTPPPSTTSSAPSTSSPRATPSSSTTRACTRRPRAATARCSPPPACPCRRFRPPPRSSTPRHPTARSWSSATPTSRARPSCS